MFLFYSCVRGGFFFFVFCVSCVFTLFHCELFVFGVLSAGHSGHFSFLENVLV